MQHTLLLHKKRCTYNLWRAHFDATQKNAAQINGRAHFAAAQKTLHI
jgi:hypothetical protein